MGFFCVITNMPGAVAAAAWVSRASKVDCTGSIGVAIGGRGPDISVGEMLGPGPWVFGFGRVGGIVAGSTPVSDAKNKPPMVQLIIPQSTATRRRATDSCDYSSEEDT